MAIEWGAWENHIRVGLDVSWEAISHSESVATCTIKVYTDVDQTWSDTQTLNYGGSISGSTTFSNNQTSGSGAVLRATKTYDYTYGSSSYGSSPGSRTFSATLSGAYNGATPSKSVTTNIPARPYGAPADPTAVDSTRISDTSIKTTWSNHATAGEPYDSLDVQIDTGANDVWNQIVGSPGGSATSFTDSSNVTTNAAWRYRVRAVNSVGTSGWVQGDLIYTTPAPPDGATRSGTGTAQTVSWANHVSSYVAYQTEVWRSVNGVYSLLATVASGVTSYNDTVSTSDKVKYKIRAKTNGGTQGTLYSAYSAETTETAGVTSPPNAPTGLNPDASTMVSPKTTTDLTWTFNPTDTSSQVSYQVRWSTNGGTSWTTEAQTTSSVSKWTAPANKFPDNSTITWQVMTWGGNATGSPWSASATFKTVGDPNALREQKRVVRMDLSTGQLETSKVGVLPAIGSMMLWPGETAPSGWLISEGGTFDGNVYPGLLGVLGTTTLPYRPPEWYPEAADTNNVMNAASGWTRGHADFRMLPGNLVRCSTSWTRSGAVISLGNPDYTNQTIATFASGMTRYVPNATQIVGANDGGPTNHAINGSGWILTGGMNDNAWTNANIDTNDVKGADGIYSVDPPTAAPRFRWIIKAE